MSSGRERDACGVDAMGFQLVALSLRTLDQRVEVDVVESSARVRQIAQVRPQQLLAVESERQRLQLKKAAERRVAAQTSVRLQPADPLRDKRKRPLHWAEREFEPPTGAAEAADKFDPIQQAASG